VKLIVGLGNPGRKFSGTRHNVGFDVIAELVRRAGAAGSRTKFEAEVWEGSLAGDRVLLACPQTYMNLSGRSIQQMLAFHKLPLSDLLVICDDLNLPTGKIRLRKNGTAGGQKGLQNTIDQLGTTEFARLRIGIDRPKPPMEATDYVLQKFNSYDKDLIEPAVFRASEGVELFIRHGLDKAMNTINAEPKPDSGDEPARGETTS
jgi:PTH1 family peptidyl-tRNA hydrolase